MARLRRNLLAASLLLAVTAPATARGDESTGTLTLDALSFISFQDLQNYQIPSGSALVFHFGAPAADGSIPVRLDAGGITIAPIPLDRGTLQYGIAGTASGTLRRAASGVVLELSATVTATLARPEGGGTFSYPMHFTTEAASAADRAGTDRVFVEGARLDLASRYVQLVAATTNRTEAYPEPGKAVYTVLSGQFDRLPALP